MGIIHWFHLIGRLVDIHVVEQSVVFTVPFNDWNESDGKGVWEEVTGHMSPWQPQTKQYASHEGIPYFNHRTRHTCQQWAGRLWNM